MIGDKQTKLEGYTIIELLVVVLLFSLSMVILSQTYVSFIRLSRKTANAAVVQQDMRFTLEYISRAVRNTPIDYSVGISSVSSSLNLISQTGEEIIITLSDVGAGDTQCFDDVNIRCLRITKDGGATWAPLTSKNVNVNDFKIFIYPTDSPFNLIAGSYPNDNQPLVTAELSLTYQSNQERERITLDAQTTISSRNYAR
ncbi:hypothetical protein KKG46_01755 [Patescibacteria group bacterium]|nr:hypothetical protein [Patescibacteria group bacterium]